MKMTSNKTSFALIKYIILEDVDAYVHLRKYLKLWCTERSDWVKLCADNSGDQ